MEHGLWDSARTGRRLSLTLALLVCGSCLSMGQGEADPGDDVAAWLRILDERLYTPPPLDAVAFHFRPRHDLGGEVVPAPYVVSYQWRRDVGDRVDLLGVDEAVIPQLPGGTKEQHAKVLADFRIAARQLLGLVQPPRLGATYSGWHGRVLRREVNHEEWVSLMLEPRNHPRLRSVLIRLRREGIPERMEKVFLSGDRQMIHLTYEKRPEGFVPTKIQNLHTPATPGQVAMDSAYLIKYQRVAQTLLPASVEQMGKNLPPGLQGVTELTNMRINGDVPAFEPQPK